MAEYVRVAVDVMGGDFAPVEPVKGAIAAVNENEKIQVVLYGKEEIIKEELAKYQYNPSQVEIVNCTEKIETAEPPVMAIRSKKDSSIVRAMQIGRAHV